MCARRLSIRREGPERAEEKKSRRGESFGIEARQFRLGVFPPVFRPQTRPAPLEWFAMGSWYTIGLLAGVGAAVGVLVAGLFPRLAIAALGATAVAVGIGFA